jgi:Protein of unknown function (DUF3833)
MLWRCVTICMKKILRISLLGLSLLALNACASSKITDFSAGKPQLVLEDYFAGKTSATGLFEDRFGKFRRQFVVEITGSVSGDTLTLDERFVYDDGEKQQRIWKLKRTSPTTYEGRADDVNGVAQGRLVGNAFQFKYTVDLKVGTNKDGSPKLWKVKFDDWMFLQPSGVILNRAFVSRYGVHIGSVTLSFHRYGSAARR